VGQLTFSATAYESQDDDSDYDEYPSDDVEKGADNSDYSDHSSGSESDDSSSSHHSHRKEKRDPSKRRSSNSKVSFPTTGRCDNCAQDHATKSCPGTKFFQAGELEEDIVRVKAMEAFKVARLPKDAGDYRAWRNAFCTLISDLT
jgi:hypothetical protein